QGGEDPGTLGHDLDPGLVPLQVFGIALGGHPDVLAVDDELAVPDLDGPVEASVDGIVFQEVGQVVHFQKVVYGDHFHIIPIHGGPEDQSSYSSESVDSNFQF